MVYTDGIFYLFFILFRKYINCKHYVVVDIVPYIKTLLLKALWLASSFSLFFYLFDEKYSKIVILWKYKKLAVFYFNIFDLINIFIPVMAKLYHF